VNKYYLKDKSNSTGRVHFGVNVFPLSCGEIESNQNSRNCSPPGMDYNSIQPDRGCKTEFRSTLTVVLIKILFALSHPFPRQKTSISMMDEEEDSDDNSIDNEPIQKRQILYQSDDDDDNFAFLLKSHAFLKHKGSRPGKSANMNRQQACGHEHIVANYFATNPVYGEQHFRRQFMR
jgi:hypothetical protein